MYRQNQPDRFQTYPTSTPNDISGVQQSLVPFPEKAKYIRDWALVKRARFNAAKRYERKQNASISAFVVCGICGFLIPFYTLLFQDVLNVNTRNLLEFTSYAIGSISLILGLVEQARGYSDKQRRFYDCAINVNKVLRHLRSANISKNEDLIPYIREYEHIVDHCGENHDDIDYSIAILQGQLGQGDDHNRAVIEKKLFRLKLYESFVVYRIYLILWGVPLIIAMITSLLVML